MHDLGSLEEDGQVGVVVVDPVELFDLVSRGYSVAELEVVVLLLREVDDQVVVSVVFVEEAGDLGELVAVGGRDEAFRGVGHRDEPRRDVGQVEVVVLVFVAGLLPRDHLPQHRLHCFALDPAAPELINTFFRGQLSWSGWETRVACNPGRPWSTAGVSPGLIYLEPEDRVFSVRYWSHTRH